ncbi:MAG: D-alanyl-lipoteichoic acid biosynthesis protein DltB [Blautia sp.]|nr:D-alanyl-lipoteichoic acid biosynthesis protein DltB [Blautia sp.]
MSYYEGLAFFTCMLLILAGALVLGYLEKPLRWYGLAASLAIAAMVLGKEPDKLFFFLFFYVWSMGLIWGYKKLRERKGRVVWLYRLFVAGAILPLILCKITALTERSLFGFVGISYLTFRVVQVLIEIYDGVIKQISFAETTAFLLFFPSFCSGPIDRSRRFHTDWERKMPRDEYLELCSIGIQKLLLGAVYKIAIASMAYRWMTQAEMGERWFHWIGVAYSYGIYLFFDFAGYSLMAVGTAYILGVRLPDNFRAPFISKDIREFWDRWHISLSHWFRDFIFTRFIMLSTKKKWFGSRLNRACAGFFINMGIMGIWHGISLPYILYGFYHGALLALTEWYQKKSGFYKKNKDKKWYQIISWFVTMQLVFFGFLLFSGKLFVQE